MLGSPLTGLQVNSTPETSASTISWTATPIAGSSSGAEPRRGTRSPAGCRGSPSSRAPRRRPARRRAPRGTSPAGRRRSPPGCPRRARSSGPRPAARADPPARRSARDLVAHRIRDGRRAHRLADRVRRGADGLDVARRDPRHRGGDRAAEPRLVDEGAERASSRRRTRAGPGSRRRSARRASRSCRRTPRRRARRSSASGRVWPASLTRGSSPCRPCRRRGSSGPSLICEVARPVPTTAGSPYSRQTIAACDMTPPMSVTAALDLREDRRPGGRGDAADEDLAVADVADLARPSCTTRARPSTTPGDAAVPVSSRAALLRRAPTRARAASSRPRA